MYYEILIFIYLQGFSGLKGQKGEPARFVQAIRGDMGDTGPEGLPGSDVSLCLILKYIFIPKAIKKCFF